MKIIKLLGIIVLTLFLTACNNSEKKASTEDQTIELKETTANTENGKTSGLSSCDRFLNEYESWMNGFIEIMARHKDDPVGLVGDPEYTKTMGEGIDWATRWMQQPQACMANSNYSKRFDAIQNRAEEKMKELGLK